jgi:hypothetical protein
VDFYPTKDDMANVLVNLVFNFLKKEVPRDQVCLWCLYVVVETVSDAAASSLADPR